MIILFVVLFLYVDVCKLQLNEKLYASEINYVEVVRNSNGINNAFCVDVKYCSHLNIEKKTLLISTDLKGITVQTMSRIGLE